MSGHWVMTSHTTSCLVEIGGFWNLSHLGECPCSLAHVSSLHAGYFVFFKYLGITYGSLRAKMMQRYAGQWQLSLLGSVIPVLTLYLFWASVSFFRAKWMLYSKSAPMNVIYRAHHVSGWAKFIRGHTRPLTLDELEWSWYFIVTLRLISWYFWMS